MFHSLLSKLTLAFLLVAMLTTGLVALFIRLTSVERLSNLLVEQQRNDLKTFLLEYYQEKGSWEGLSEQWRNYRLFIIKRNIPTPPPPENRDKKNQSVFPDNYPPPKPFQFVGFADPQGNILIPVFSGDAPIPTTLPREILNASTALIYNNKTIGYIISSPMKPRFNPAEDAFLRRTNEALIYAVLIAMVFALFIGIFLARTLIRPLQTLTQAVHNITKGNLEQEVNIQTKDEIGQLAAAFNIMSREVARVNRLHRQMTADIAHDLRTPLMVIAGYIESMKDGVLQPTPQRLSLIYKEIERLQKLVGDLRMLSQADAGELILNLQPLDPKNFLAHVAETFSQTATQQGISIILQNNDYVSQIYADEVRLMQVFDNLIANALRYTPNGGKIEIGAYNENDKVIMFVRDNGIGIPAEDIPNIFDRFYRVDKSRTDSDESGLGLAIVKALVTAHNASISVESTYGEYTLFKIAFNPYPAA